MKILMLGWELPPRISGGLGVASQGVAEGLASLGHQVIFFLPKKRKGHASDHFKIVDAAKQNLDNKFWKKKSLITQTLRETELGVRLVPYLPPEVFEIAKEKQITVEKIEDHHETDLVDKVKMSGEYQESLHNEISKYAMLATQFANNKKFEAIHAHDWVTFKAGIMAAKETGIPLYLHCHSTEYDRNGVYAQPAIIQEEQKGFEAARKIFCVSQKLKNTIIGQYQIEAEKIAVVPNATEVRKDKKSPTKRKKKEVVFIGRFTNQKNPNAFIDLARDMISRGADCQFSMIGDGCLRESLELKVRQNNLMDRFEFTGFLSREKVLKKLDEVDLLVTPSNSEPFGLVILEAVMKKVPVATVAGVGVAEFIPSLSQVNGWDHYNFVQLLEKLLTDKAFRDAQVEKCFSEAAELSWPNSAKIIENIYKS